MKLRPTIFLSGVSSEFASFREAVEVEVQKKGCFAENQSSFGVDYRTVEEMLRRRISDADAVIHIVGFRFGFEPKERPADKPRRSYTQMEYDIARELEKPVYVFLSSDASVCDAAGEEDPEVTALQLAHRQAIKSTNNLRYTFKDKDELRHLAAEIDVVAQADFRVDISRIDKYAPSELIGREDELALLNDAWLKVRRAEPQRAHILTFVALGGEGKTSLVAKWLADLAYQNWPGCDSAFAWSFYSQGTREQYAASSDLFLKEAITFFGDAADKEFAASPAGAYEKGQRLARIVSPHRALLVLDGLEPLQFSPTSPTPGEFKDSGIAALLRGLAADGKGLCIVTSRYSLPNLKAYWQTTSHEIVLNRLSLEAGVCLLQRLGVKGSIKEFRKLVDDVKGHALTLNLLGTYIRDAHNGDIRRRDLVNLEEADAEEQGGHAFRVMDAYAHALESEGQSGQRALAVLRLLGLFDRPVNTDCLKALTQEPVIRGLTDPLVRLSEAQRNLTFKRLEDAHLLTVNREVWGTVASCDAHPLLREYFARQLRTLQPAAWRAAHRRLYDHLCMTTPDKEEPTLEELQPLYHAIAHGCHAGLQQKVCDDVYDARILRGRSHYSWYRLGAYGSELAAQASFFDKPWIRLSARLSEHSQAWLLNQTAFCLGALGRLTEALELLRAGLPIEQKNNDWQNLTARLTNLCRFELSLGQISRALIHAKNSVSYAIQGNAAFRWVVAHCVYGEVLHNAGRFDDAADQFSEAERILKDRVAGYSLLFGTGGFQYCELLLTKSEHAAWRRTLELEDLVCTEPKGYGDIASMIALRKVSRRATKTFQWAGSNGHNTLLDMALDHLTLAHVELFQTVSFIRGPLRNAEKFNLSTQVDEAVNALRRAGNQDYITRGLLTRSWVRFLCNARTGLESAQSDLDEAWESSERGPMRLHMADIHLYRARLFFREKEYPWESPEADLRAARKLIEQCGYWRRKEELEDAERVILKKSM